MDSCDVLGSELIWMILFAGFITSRLGRCNFSNKVKTCFMDIHEKSRRKGMFWGFKQLGWMVGEVW